MSGISFLVDERGHKLAAVIDLGRHGRVWEDFHDTLMAKSRAGEPSKTLGEVCRKSAMRQK